VNLCLFMELNYNWSKASSSAKLASWFTDDERETRCITAHNTKENGILFGKHQPGGAGMLCLHKYLQYAWRPTVDPRGLGRWCSWLFFCNPTHVTRIVVAHHLCASNTKGLKTVYQQHMQCIQSRGLSSNPVNLFDNDLSKQVKEWRGKGKRVITLMDINDHPLQNKLYRKLKDHNTNMEEFTHKCWGSKEPYTHHSGKSPIDGGYKTPEVKIVNFAILTFAESPGDHQLFVLDVSTRSLLGISRYKVCQPVSHRLMTSQETSGKKYNEIIREQFKIHCIEERLNMVDNMTRYCRYPLPQWLHSMIIKLYKQMMEIRIHAEKNCRKILRPHNDFSPTIKMWYDRIHAYLQLIRMKEGKTNNMGNILQFAQHQHINNPEGLTMEELQDSLQFARIRRADLRKQAEGLRKTHLRDCLVDSMEKKQKKRMAAIKQTINREESKRTWYLIKQTVRDPQSPSVFKVQHVINGETQEYEIQEDVENTIQQECKIQFSLAHSTPIIMTLLGKRLQYLYNKSFS
jgi:hypothetical protein